MFHTADNTALTPDTTYHPHEVLTRRGRWVQLRPIVPGDAALLVELYHRLSPETRLRRFLAPLPDLTDEQLQPHACRLATIDRRREEGLIATVEEEGAEHAVGVVRLAAETAGATLAEFAILVRDDYQREGLGCALMEQLLQLAGARGLHGLWGVCDPQNKPLMRLLRRCCPRVTTTFQRGEMHVAIALCAGRASVS